MIFSLGSSNTIIYVGPMIIRDKWKKHTMEDRGQVIRSRCENMPLNSNIVKKIQNMHMNCLYWMKEWQFVDNNDWWIMMRVVSDTWIDCYNSSTQFHNIAPHGRKYLSQMNKDKTTMVLSLTAIQDMLSVIYAQFEHVSKWRILYHGYMN